jgi:hypothetical protein
VRLSGGGIYPKDKDAMRNQVNSPWCLFMYWQRLYGPSRYPLVQIVGRAARKMIRTAERLRDSIH